jgi:CelD/BcsL family acetyltransferase involved in cellulose biosynthesis
LKKQVISTCPYILLPETWDIYKNQYCPSKKRLKTLLYSQRSLEKDHTVELQELNGDDDSLDAKLQILYKLHQQRWLAQIGKSKFTEQRSRDFYFEVSKILRKNGWLSLSSLNVDGKPVALIWGFKYQNVWMDMTPVFDPEYSKFSVGQIQIMKIIESAIQEGFTKFDFLKGGSEYKQRWAQNTIDNIQFIITKNDFRARIRPLLLRIIIKLQNISERSFSENIGLLYRRLLHRKKPAG